MDANTIQLVSQLGSTGIVLVILYFLWQEYRVQAAYIRERLDQSDAERKVIAQELGLSTQQLKIQAAQFRGRPMSSSGQEETH